MKLLRDYNIMKIKNSKTGRYPEITTKRKYVKKSKVKIQNSKVLNKSKSLTRNKIINNK